MAETKGKLNLTRDMSPVETALFDALYDYGLPAVLDGLGALCRRHAKWSREDREPRAARKWETAGNKLHDLSLKSEVQS